MTHPCIWGDCSEPGIALYIDWGWMCAAHDKQNGEEYAAYERERALEAEAEATEWQTRKEFAQAMYIVQLAPIHNSLQHEARRAALEAIKLELEARS